MKKFLLIKIQKQSLMSEQKQSAQTKILIQNIFRISTSFCLLVGRWKKDLKDDLFDEIFVSLSTVFDDQSSERSWVRVGKLNLKFCEHLGRI